MQLTAPSLDQGVLGCQIRRGLGVQPHVMRGMGMVEEAEAPSWIENTFDQYTTHFKTNKKMGFSGFQGLRDV